jgi:hypothetical protein
VAVEAGQATLELEIALADGTVVVRGGAVLALD